MSLPLIVLILVFIGIALRQILRIPLRIWQIVSIGALIVLFTGQISPILAYRSVDWTIIFFLWGMLVVGKAMETSGLLNLTVMKYFSSKSSQKKIYALIIFGLGILSAFLLNDTVAIMATPLLLITAATRKIPSRNLLLALAFAVTIGSVMSPIGNPQNLFVALHGELENPFIDFFYLLGPPTILNLILLYLYALFFWKTPEMPTETLEPIEYQSRDGLYCKIALGGLIALLIIWTIHPSIFEISLIAIIPAIFLLITQSRRLEIFQYLDWPTLFFFIALFILIQSVWQTSSLHETLAQPNWYTESIPGVMLVSMFLSQLISNVPMVIVYLPIIRQFTDSSLMILALAAGSTIAGNLLIFGAASNMIIIQNSETRGQKAFSFFEFAKHGIPITIITFLVYWGYLSFFR